MSKSKSLAVAALAGLLGASVMMASVASAEEHAAGDTAKAAASDHAKEKHACKGKNSCKGNSPDGKNSCKGKSSCATDGSMKPSDMK